MSGLSKAAGRKSVVIDLQPLAQELKSICEEAAAAILTIYRQPDRWQTQSKSDASPVTAADWAAHQVIQSRLQALTPDWPLLSEEAADIPWAERQTWHTYWLVDPLDGTKEFLDRNDEFTVNLALIQAGRPILGAVYQPVTQVCYLGGPGWGSYKMTPDGSSQPLRVRSLGASPINILTSHRHGLERLEHFKRCLERQALRFTTTPLGSSLKFCRLAEGQADVYPRLGPTGEWDTAAAQAILEAAGGQLVDWSFQPLTYNQKPDLLNPDFIALADSKAGWSAWLSEMTLKLDSKSRIK